PPSRRLQHPVHGRPRRVEAVSQHRQPAHERHVRGGRKLIPRAPSAAAEARAHRARTSSSTGAEPARLRSRFLMRTPMPAGASDGAFSSTGRPTRSDILHPEIYGGIKVFEASVPWI